MKKLKFYFSVSASLWIMLSVVAGMTFTSCGKTVILRYDDYLKKQQEAIDSLIAKEGFEILNKYPDSGVFGEKQFVLLDNGCYLNVVDSGNGVRAIPDHTVVKMRCSITGLTPNYSLFDDSKEPVRFIYGKIGEVKIKSYENRRDPAYLLLSVGVESALKYVGHSAIVLMIVPFYNGQNQCGLYTSSNPHGGIGSAYQDSERTPIYYDKILFQFENED